MLIWPAWRRFWILALVIMVVASVALEAAKILVVNAPENADVIVVLAGETDRRPLLALDLLHRGYAPRITLDVPAATKIYDTTALQIAGNYVRALPEAPSIQICPISGLSTREEAHDVTKCLASTGAGRILLVTSDYHSRRALSIFRHELPGTKFSAAAARDDTQFGIHWWAHRQWAKTCLDEWLRLIWWEAVDRWRGA